MPAGNSPLKPASAETGFMLSLPPPENPFLSDEPFRRTLAWYLPSKLFDAIAPELVAFADESISEQTKAWGSNAEVQQPYVKAHDVWGVRYDADRLVTSDGWKQLRAWGQRNGIVALGYEPKYENYRRIVQHATGYLFSPSAGLTTCPLSMSDGAACLLKQFLPSLPSSHPFHEVYSRLISREDGWTSGQWMTERAGGSDVQNSDTFATYAPLPNKSSEIGALDEGDYLVSGFKFFSSATDADVTVLLAKTESGKLSAFLAPLKKTVRDPITGKTKVVTNGIRIHRLKNKLGTKQLPTAELELKDVRAHLVGPLDRGVATISHILNITRCWACMGSVAGWRRCTSTAKRFAKARKTLDQPLWTLPLHLRTLADNELKLRGALHFSFFVMALMGFNESHFPSDNDAPGTSSAPMPQVGKEAYVVLRALTATAKAVINKNAFVGIQECMESMGGVGYMDEPDEPENNVARALRDTSVNTIWEGTTNVLSSELLRYLLKDIDNLETFNRWICRSIGLLNTDVFRNALTRAWGTLYDRLAKNKDRLLDILANGRRIMFSLAWIVCGLLLASDAQRDDDAVAVELARRWILNAEGGVGEWVLADVVRADPNAQFHEGEERARWDCRIVWGEELPEYAPAGGRRRATTVAPSKI